VRTENSPDVRVVALSRRTWAALAAAFVVLLLIFGTMITLLVQQRALIDHQESIAERQAAHSLPILRTLDALLGDGSALREGAGRAQDLADDVKRAHLPRVGSLLDDNLPALAQIPGLLAESLAVQRSTLDRTDTSLAVQRETLGLTHESVGIQHQTLGLTQESVDIQRETLGLLRRSLDAQLGVLAIARETLDHVRSLDAKTGGPAPVVSGGG
jgi:hypothetical protein